MSFLYVISRCERVVSSRWNTPRRLIVSVLLLASIAMTQAAEPSGEPEEPDFFFLTGGPYTQQKYSPQLIWANQWLQHGSVTSLQEFSSGARFEFGLTDRLEADFELGTRSTRQRINGERLVQTELEATLIGARYRVLTEDSSPITLTLGPQVTIPPRATSDLGNRASYGVDLTAAKDWGGPVFAAASANWHVTPGVRRSEGTSSRVSLDQLSYAVALGFRPLEKTTRSETKHDVHIFVEALRTGEDAIEDQQVTRELHFFLAPGVRYGFLTKSGVLTELGLALPIGLNRASPDWGLLVQFQVELPTLF